MAETRSSVPYSPCSTKAQPPGQFREEHCPWLVNCLAYHSPKFEARIERDRIGGQRIGFFDDVEAGEDGWTSTGWQVTDGILENGIGVVTVDTKGVPSEQYPEPAGNNAMSLLSVHDMTVDPKTQSGSMNISETPADSGRVKVSIIANHADHILRSAYVFGVIQP